MSLDASKWSILDRVDDLKYVLLLMAFALTADVALAVFTGTNLLTFTWDEISRYPGRLLLLVIGFGMLISLGGAILSYVLGELLGWIVWTVQGWLNWPSPERPSRHQYVLLGVAEEQLIRVPNEVVQRRVDEQRLERAKESARWYSLYRTAFVCLFLLSISLLIGGTTMKLLAEYGRYAIIVPFAAAAFPVGYHLWAGPPLHRYNYVLWPELAWEILKKHHEEPPARR